ncbi:hypothetical protein BH11MYX3_BH11MYX3_11220 [soil metagenome]
MARRLRTRRIGCAIVSACGFTATRSDRVQDSGPDPVDSAVDAYIPDAGMCGTMTAECIGNNSTLRTCEVSGQPPRDYMCSWGCSTMPDAHCAKLVPSGGVVTTADLDPYPSLMDITITAAPTATLNTDDGSITGVRAAGAGIISGVDFTIRGNIAVFRFNKLTINGPLLNIRGARAVALVSTSDININAEINAQGDCSARTPGPGGGSGGAAAKSGTGSGPGGAGGGTNTTCSGGGGGGHGAGGGDGGGANNDGPQFGMATIAQLLGGGGGGGGGGDQGGDGGGGGGALQLVANNRVTISALAPFAGGINAGGCGGKAGNACGGGAGAGGLVLIEASVIDFRSATLAVNGGGGGGGSNGEAGERASLSTTKASGGDGGGGPGNGNSGGDGGDGGDNDIAIGANGEAKSRSGGGGGGVGRMRFNTLSGSIVTSGTVVFSPPLAGGPTATVTRGVAIIQ